MDMHTGAIVGCLAVLPGFVEDFVLAASKDLGWHGWRGSKLCGQEQVGKICFREK